MEDWAPFSNSEVEIGGYDLWCEDNYLSPFMAVMDNRLSGLLEVLPVSKEDTLYDLGCGDARVLIEFAKKGVKGVGVDLDEVQVTKASQKVEEAQLSHMVSVFQGDFLTIELSEATVIYVFLLPKALELLKHRFIEHMQTGKLKLVVSILYEIPEWPYEVKEFPSISGFFYYKDTLTQ
mmetsp:Transcript_12902/g.18835  ORF Transcript_12902/g.18835 Transcript_12902/m.18835 type:complete len:178 (+) Transcript_12902:490-1023(+)